jgi:glycosyltransferase involved in cell wall biosynthesis
MKILVAAPQPFFVERGTPIAVRWLAEHLAQAGHEVDLLTYAEGRDIPLPGVRLIRAGPPRARGAPIGFSWKKLVCDAGLLRSMVRLLRAKTYDVVHAGEESIFLAMPLKHFFPFRLVYDMDSSLADQIVEKWPSLRILRHPLEWAERRAVRASDLILPVCQRLAEKVRAMDPTARVEVLHDIAMESAPAGSVDDLRALAGRPDCLALYAGNLEFYQGVEVFIRALGRASASTRAHLVVIGGDEAGRAACRRAAQEAGVADRVHAIGPRPLADLPAYLRQADILISPRVRGVNTPMKIYSYMLSGRSILATRIPSHLQVLDDACAELAEPDPDSLARGFERLAGDAERRNALGRLAQQRARDRYSEDHYRRVLERAYRAL